MSKEGIITSWLAILAFCVIVWVFAIIGFVHVVGGCAISQSINEPAIKPICPPTTGKEYQELRKWRSMIGQWIEPSGTSGNDR